MCSWNVGEGVILYLKSQNVSIKVFLFERDQEEWVSSGINKR